MKKEQKKEQNLIEKLKKLGYIYCPDIRDRTSVEQNFRQKFEALNKVRLTDNEFDRLLENIVSPDVFACSALLRHINNSRTSYDLSSSKKRNFFSRA